MGHLLSGNCLQRNTATAGGWHSRNVSMLNTRGTWLLQVVLIFIVSSMMGCTVHCAPLLRTSTSFNIDQEGVTEETATLSFNLLNSNTMINSATDMYEYVTATEIVTELVVEDPDEINVISVLPEINGTPVTKTVESRGSHIDDESEDVDEIAKQLLNSGCSLSRRQKRSQPTGCEIKLLTLGGKYLRISGGTVRSEIFSQYGTFVTISNAGGPTLVRIQDTTTHKYIHMDGAGRLYMASLSSQQLARNYGPSVWRENATSISFTYHQVNSSGNKWYLQLGDNGVQEKSNRHARFIKVDCSDNY